MDGFFELFYALFTNPLIIFIIITVALALSILSVVTSLIVARKLSSVVTAAAQKPVPVATQAVTSNIAATPSKPSPVQIPSKPDTGYVKISGGLESLEEISGVLSVNSIFLFNLSGLPIEAYNVKEEDRLASALADIVITLRNSGFPTESITIKNGVQGVIISVSKVGEMDVYALLISGPGTVLDIEEARELLRNYVSMIVSGERS